MSAAPSRLPLALLAVAALGLCGIPATGVDLASEFTPRLVYSEPSVISFLDESAVAHVADGFDRLVTADDGLWAKSIAAQLGLYIARPEERELRLRLRPHFDETLPAQRVSVSWDSTWLGECAFDKAKGWQWQEFTFPLPREAQSQGLNTLSFHSLHAVSRREVNKDKGEVPRAFAIQRLELSPGGAAGPAVTTTLSGAIQQSPRTALHFPFLAPGSGDVSLTVSGALAADCAILLRWDGPDGLAVERIFKSAGETVESRTFAVPYPPGEPVELVLDARSCASDSAWSQLELSIPETASNTDEAEAAAPASAPANVVLIVLDALRADALHCYGGSRPVSPNIDALAARDAQVFLRAYSAAPYTYASTWSLLLGAYPFCHGAYSAGFVPNSEHPRLQDTLGAAGVVTGCVSANPYLAPARGNGTGFTEFHDTVEDFDGHPEGQIELTTAAAVGFIERHKDVPFFLYVHYRQPHAPYVAPVPFMESLARDLPAGRPDMQALLMDQSINDALVPGEEGLRYLRARYDENLMAVDAEVGRLTEAIRQMASARETVVIITADHGEAFGEHGALGHNSTVFREMLHVPLILRPMSGTGEETISITTPVSTTSLYATICALLGVKHDGRPALAGSAAPPAPADLLAYAQCEVPRNGMETYVFPRYTLIRDSRGTYRDVYDMQLDPAQKSPLGVFRPVLLNYLESLALQWKASHSAGALPPQKVDLKLDAETEEALRGLGYL